MDQAVRDAISTGYGFAEPTLVIGSAMHEGELFNDVRVAVPMSTLNRHGLVAGATGDTYAAWVMTTQGEPNGLAILGAWLQSWYWFALLGLAFIALPLAA